MTKGVLVVAITSLILHILIGWMWGAAGAVFGGWLVGEKGWIVGLIGIATSWTAIIIYSYVSASYQVLEMARVVGELMGGLPPFSTFVVTVLMGALLGLFGGFLGSSIAAIQHREKV